MMVVNDGRYTLQLVLIKSQEWILAKHTGYCSESLEDENKGDSLLGNTDEKNARFYL